MDQAKIGQVLERLAPAAYPKEITGTNPSDHRQFSG
jgi:hypothetical protein